VPQLSANIEPFLDLSLPLPVPTEPVRLRVEPCALLLADP
jgi:hypothetical protein